MRKEKKFEVISGENLSLMMSAFVIRDKQTGVLYLFAKSGYGGGLTPLLDAEGKPIVEKSNE